eukprot:CCRYP_002650-RA/>CCRYP_002650-RA protein AED:0.78 eAED:0.35 QI:0/0/0/0.5/0/0/2/0/563
MKPSMQRASKNFGGDYIGYGAQTTKTILEHLRTEWCVVTTLEKKQASAAFHVQWDLTSHITKFAGNLTSNRSSAETSAYPLGCHQGPVLRGRHVLVRHVRRQGNAGMGTQTLRQTKRGTPPKLAVTLYKSKEKFNAERIARTGGCDSANTFINTGSVGSTSLGTLSPSDHQTILEYTNSLETALEHTQEHAAALTTTQDHRLKQLETQQQELLSQTTKFMALLTAQQSIPTPGTTTGGQQRTARRNTRSTTAKSPATATRARKVMSTMKAAPVLPSKEQGQSVLSGTWPRCRILWSLVLIVFLNNVRNTKLLDSTSRIFTTTHAVSASPFLHTTATTNSKQWRLACTNKPSHTIHPLKLTGTINIHNTATHMSPAPSRKVSTTVPSHQQSATLAPPPQQAPYMTHSSTLRPAPPKYLCYRQEPPPQPQSKHSSSSMCVRPPTQSTLYQTFTKHYSVVANSLAPTTQPCTTNTKSTSTTPPLSTSPERAVLTGYRCPRTGLWRIPLRPVTVNDNTDTLILDSKCGLQSTHPDIMYLHLHTSENTSKPPYNATQTIYSMCMNSPA